MTDLPIENAKKNLKKSKHNNKNKSFSFHQKAYNSTISQAGAPLTNKSKRKEIDIILIGCSTGGPKALMRLLPELCSHISLPILLVQHMHPNFTASLAESLDRHCSHKVLEARSGEPIQNDRIYIAPGGKHMLVRKSPNGNFIIGLNTQPPENGCRPAVDVLFRSAATHYSNKSVAILLTGMGTDGTEGLQHLHSEGTHIIVQDENSSVVWGMPGSAVKSGNVHEILPLEKIATAITKVCQ